MLGGGPDEKVGGAPKNSGLKGASEKKIRLWRGVPENKKLSLSLKKYTILLQQMKCQSINSDKKLYT